MKRILIILLGLLTLTAMPARAQEQAPLPVKFNPDYALQDIRADYGMYTSISPSSIDGNYLQISYTRLFWRRFAWKAGACFLTNPGGYDFLLGAPVAIAYKSGTTPFEDAIAYGLEGALTSTVIDGIFGNTDRIADDILTNLLLVLFRRMEFYAGVTPGVCLGEAMLGSNEEVFGRFTLTGDLGMVLSLPIWRFSLNLTPAFHYAFIGNYQIDNRVPRAYFSIGAGVNYLF